MDELTVDNELEEARRRKAFTGLMLALAILALILIGVVLLARWQSRGLDFAIRFEDAKSLAAGGKVTLSGVPIGEVRSVTLVGEDEVLVGVRVEDQHAELVKEGATAVIASPTFPNVSGQKVVEIHNPLDPQSGPLAEGARIEGQDGLVAIKAWEIKQKLRGLGEGASGTVRSMAEKMSLLLEELKDIPESPEIEAALEKMSRLADDLAVKGKEGLAALGAEWEELRTLIGPLLVVLKEKSKDRAIQALAAALKLIESKTGPLRERLAAEPTPAATEAQGDVVAPKEQVPADGP
jgi:ABC-type transporter Mla subunit MlaD